MTSRRKTDPFRSENVAIVVSFVASGTALAIAAFSLNTNRSSTLLISLSFALLLTTFIAVGAIALQRRLTVRYAELRIAMTGQPGAGKTVFTNLLFERLMQADSDSIGFTPAARSALATHQVVRGLDQGVWPSRTSSGGIEQRDGIISVRGRRDGTPLSSLRSLFEPYNSPASARRAEIRLEIGDSAGEYWVDIGEPSAGEYLEYVVSASAIVHVVGVDALMEPDVGVSLRQDVRDLRLAARISPNTKGSQGPKPLLVVVSKMDLLFEVIDSAEFLGLNASNLDMRDEYLRTFTPWEFSETKSFAALGDLVGDSFRFLFDQMRQLDGVFSSVAFAVSSVQAVELTSIEINQGNLGPLRWIIDNALRR